MGVICLEAAVMAMFLPETKGKPTLETLEDMINDEAKGTENDVIQNFNMEKISTDTHM